MEFQFYIKDKEAYKKLSIIPPSGSGWAYFKGLKMTVENELLNIKNDIISTYGTDFDVVLTRPTIDNKDKQEKLDILVGIRNINNEMKKTLSVLLYNEEFIICDKCGGRMIKTPINVRYEKFGQKFIIKEEVIPFHITNSFMCEDCCRAISEENYYEMQGNINLRIKLLDEGERFVPSVFGYWHYEDNPKYIKKDKIETKTDCDHSWKREFEYINIDGTKSQFVKIIETCHYCNEKRCIK